MKVSRVFTRLCEAFPKNRTMIMQGGTSSTKTYSTLQFIYILATQLKKPSVFSVVSESVPHLRRGALRDWMSIIGEDYDPEMHHKTDETFKVGNSLIEFFAIDHPDKARGGRRDYLYINECNRVNRDMYDQLEVRTRCKVFLDYNPTTRFWAHDLPHGGETGNWFDVSTYLDAKDGLGNWLIEDSIIRSIESRRLLNPNWWRVYGEGQIGQLEGLILPEFELVDRMPDIDTTIGLDFGFTNDATACVESGVQGEYLYINELFWGTGFTNQAIINKLRERGVPYDYQGYADCAEPKSIREINDAGYVGIKPCVKGEDSFRAGIDHLKKYKLRVTQSSVNVIKEFRNASWAQDVTGKFTNKAAHGFLNSIDATRYSRNEDISPRLVSVGGNI